jgi:hypothetical protein
MRRATGLHREGTFRPSAIERKSVPGRVAFAGASYEVAEL